MREDQWITHDDSKNIVKLIDEKNKAFKNNIIIINLDYNIVEDAVVVVKIENKILRNIILRKNFRNEHIKKNAFNEDTKF